VVGGNQEEEEGKKRTCVEMLAGREQGEERELSCGGCVR